MASTPIRHNFDTFALRSNTIGPLGQHACRFDARCLQQMAHTSGYTGYTRYTRAWLVAANTDRNVRLPFGFQ